MQSRFGSSGIVSLAHRPDPACYGDLPQQAGRLWGLYASRTAYLGEVLEIIRRRGDHVAVLVDNMPDTTTFPGSVAPRDLSPEQRALGMVIPLTTPGYRHTALAQARALGVTDFPSLIDPTAVLAASSLVGEGCVINAMSVIGADTRIGRFVHINRSASIGHDVQAADFTTFGPGCIVAGQVVIERGAYISTGAVIAPKMRIGANAVVGAGAVVLRDVPERAVVLGNPARIVPGKQGGYGNPPALVPELVTIDEFMA